MVFLKKNEKNKLQFFMVFEFIYILNLKNKCLLSAGITILIIKQTYCCCQKEFWVKFLLFQKVVVMIKNKD